MSYLRMLRPSDLRTIQNTYVELFQLQPPSRRALEDALGSTRWLSLAAVAPDLSSSSRQEYMGGFVMSVVATVADFRTDMDYYSDDQAVGRPDEEEVGAGAGVGVQATGLEAIGLPKDERAVNICLLGVLPSYRRRGLARLMLRQVVDSARTASACAVFLHVRPYNTAALELYQAAGFVAAALVPDYYEGGHDTQPDERSSRGGGGSALGADAPEDSPQTAGGDAVLLALPLTEVAAAAVAAAAQSARDAVAAAVAAGQQCGAAAGASGSGAGGEGRRSGARAELDEGGDIETRPARSGGSRFIGRPRAAATTTGANGRSNGATSSSGSNNSDGSSSGGSAEVGRGAGGGAGLLGLLAAAAAGAVDGLSVLLPRRTRGGRSGAVGAGDRQVRVGDEVLVEVSGPDGEVYLRGTGEVDGAAAAAAAAAEGRGEAENGVLVAAAAAAAAHGRVDAAAMVGGDGGGDADVDIDGAAGVGAAGVGAAGVGAAPATGAFELQSTAVGGGGADGISREGGADAGPAQQCRALRAQRDGRQASGPASPARFGGVRGRGSEARGSGCRCDRGASAGPQRLLAPRAVAVSAGMARLGGLVVMRTGALRPRLRSVL